MKSLDRGLIIDSLDFLLEVYFEKVVQRDNLVNVMSDEARNETKRQDFCHGRSELNVQFIDIYIEMMI